MTEMSAGDIREPEEIFDSLYEEKRVEDAAWHPDDTETYGGFRILKNVFASPIFASVHLSENQVTKLVDRLVANNKTASDFLEWIRTQELYFDWGMLPESARKIYAAGRDIVEKHRNKNE